MPVPLRDFWQPSFGSVALSMKFSIHKILLGHNQTFHNAHRFWQYLLFILVFIGIGFVAYWRQG